MAPMEFDLSASRPRNYNGCGLRVDLTVIGESSNRSPTQTGTPFGMFTPVTQFSVFLVNKPGILSKVCGALAEEKVNLLALTGRGGVGWHQIDRASFLTIWLRRRLLRWGLAHLLQVLFRLSEPGSFVPKSVPLTKARLSMGILVNEGIDRCHV